MSRANFEALHAFRACWSNVDIGDVRQTGRFVVNAKVTYQSSKETVLDRARVTILFDGYEQGQIDIEECRQLNVDDYHLRFNPRWQNYIFDEDSDTLVVEGESEKMAGEYEVRIHPVGK